VAAGTFKGIVRGEGVLPIVARAAGLASIHISHPEGFALFHRKDLRVTVRAFEACIPMGLAVKDDPA
jgi:hypothetical protein